jgi:hypothetical protein
MKCVIASCNPYVTQDGTPLAPDDQLLLEALRAQGVDAEVVPWEAGGYPWHKADLVKIASTWNYPHAWKRYREWLQRVARVTRLCNPLEVLLWNIEKSRYFADLQQRGIPLIPTDILSRGTNVDLASRLDEHGWDRAVLKPSIATNSLGCRTVRRSDAESVAEGQAHLALFLPWQDMLLQPYLPSVETGYETSYIFVNGAYSHAFGKSAFGPRLADALTSKVVHPSPIDVELAVWIMQTVQRLLRLHLLYGRVDIVRDAQGRPLVMEIELTEPMLHLEHNGALDRLTQGIIEACYVHAY